MNREKLRKEIRERIAHVAEWQTKPPLRERVTLAVSFEALPCGYEAVEEWTLEVYFFYTPGRPARISGPPESCYPEEPEEFDIVLLVQLDQANEPWQIIDIDSEPLTEVVIEALKAKRDENW